MFNEGDKVIIKRMGKNNYSPITNFQRKYIGKTVTFCMKYNENEDGSMDCCLIIEFGHKRFVAVFLENHDEYSGLIPF